MLCPKNLPKQNVWNGNLTKLFPKGKHNIRKATARNKAIGK